MSGFVLGWQCSHAGVVVVQINWRVGVESMEANDIRRGKYFSDTDELNDIVTPKNGPNLQQHTNWSRGCGRMQLSCMLHRVRDTSVGEQFFEG